MSGEDPANPFLGIERSVMSNFRLGATRYYTAEELGLPPDPPGRRVPCEPAYVTEIDQDAGMVTRTAPELGRRLAPPPAGVPPGVGADREGRVTRPTREAYARGYAEVDGFEVTVGVEWRTEPIASFARWVEMVAREAAALADHATSTRHVENIVTSTYPDRAYFVETERAGAGVQVFQPFGMPRNAAPERTNDCPFESHADDCDCGGRAGDR